MATAEQYAKWCMMLIEGEDYIYDDIFAAMLEDGFTDEDNESISEDDDE
jgi:hypothetical protein